MKDIPDFLPFPSDFHFGTAVSAFQVEGNTGTRKSDWDEFLQKHPDIVSAKEIGPQWWEKGNAEEDIDAMAKLGMQTQRLSFEWARIEPEEGKYNTQALERYREIIDYLHAKNIQPLVTLNHYSLPDWIAKRGSWENPYIVNAFVRYVGEVAKAFPDVKTWLTINEPAVLVESGYLLPFFPPQRNGIFSAIRAHHYLLSAHKKAYKILKREIPESMVSMAFSFRWYRPENPKDLLERLYAFAVNYLDSLNYVDGVKDYIDFIGVNYYAGYYLNFNPSKMRLRIHGPESHSLKTIFFGEVKKPGAYVSDLGSPIVPGFFLELLQTLNKRYHKPIIITENGIADKKDTHRSFYLLVHVVSIWKAIQQGIDVRGYCVWATVDNLEWLEGYKEEFGLLHVDAVTGKRTLRKSAMLYSDIVTKRGIDVQRLLSTYFTNEQKEKARELIYHLFTHHGTML
ncbi:MAG: glycoside hydrolase family 1 protein [Candidatus Levyibacteriota bacterium]